MLHCRSSSRWRALYIYAITLKKSEKTNFYSKRNKNSTHNAWEVKPSIATRCSSLSLSVSCSAPLRLEITSSRRGLVSSFLANAFWLLIYLISLNRSVIEIHQKLLSERPPPVVCGLSAPAPAPLLGVLAGPSHATE